MPIFKDSYDLPDHIDNAHDYFEADGFRDGVHGDSVDEDESEDEDLSSNSHFLTESSKKPNNLSNT